MYRMGSWTYAADMVDFRARSSEFVEVEYIYSAACPSVIQSQESRRNVNYYECCPEPYVDIQINLQLAWRPTH